MGSQVTTASTEAIDAWNKRNSAKPLSFQKQPNLASKDIASKIFIAPKELSNNRKLLKVWNLKLSNLFSHEKEGLFLLLLLQLFLLQQFDAQPFSSQTELESYRSVSGSISVFSPWQFDTIQAKNCQTWPGNWLTLLKWLSKIQKLAWA